MRPCALPVICRCVPITNNQSKVALWSQILGRVVGRVVELKTKVRKDFTITKKAPTKEGLLLVESAYYRFHASWPGDAFPVI